MFSRGASITHHEIGFAIIFSDDRVEALIEVAEVCHGAVNDARRQFSRGVDYWKDNFPF